MGMTKYIDKKNPNMRNDVKKHKMKGLQIFVFRFSHRTSGANESYLMVAQPVPAFPSLLSCGLFLSLYFWWANSMFMHYHFYSLNALNALMYQE